MSRLRHEARVDKDSTQLESIITTNMPILGLQSPGPSNPSHFSLESIVRPNILSLIPYRAARDDYSEGILLDANENALGPCLPTSATKEDASPDAADALALLTDQDIAGLNRYPSPTHDSLKQAIAKLRGVPDEQWVFLGVGSDEVIDMLYRVVCVPGKDVAITLPPTYGMYKVAAQTNDVGIVQVPLITEGGRFEVDEPAVSNGAKRLTDSTARQGFRRSPRCQAALPLLAWKPNRDSDPFGCHSKDLEQPKVQGCRRCR